MSDIFSLYELGLKTLLERLGKEHLRYTEALTLQARLLENIAQTQRYGDTEIRRAERTQAVDALNNLALQTIKCSFSELSVPTTVQANSRLKDDLDDAAKSLRNLCSYLQESRDLPSKGTIDALFEALSKTMQIIKVTQERYKLDTSYLKSDDVVVTMTLLKKGGFNHKEHKDHKENSD